MGATRSPLHFFVVLGAHVPEFTEPYCKEEKFSEQASSCEDGEANADARWTPCGANSARIHGSRTLHRRTRMCREAPGGAAAVASLCVWSSGLDPSIARGAAAVDLRGPEYVDHIRSGDAGPLHSGTKRIDSDVAIAAQCTDDPARHFNRTTEQSKGAQQTPQIFEQDATGDSTYSVGHSALQRRASVPVPIGAQVTAGLPPGGTSTSSAHRPAATIEITSGSANTSVGANNSAAFTSVEERRAAKGYFCHHICRTDEPETDGLFVPWTVLYKLGPQAVRKLKEELAASMANEKTSASAQDIRERRITLVMSKDNIAALTVMTCLSLLGVIYLWKICTRHSCQCRLCRNQYRSMYLLGSGGYGSVYLVERLGDGQRFVSKKIPVREITEVDEYSREAKDLVQLRHRHIVSYEEDFVHVEYGSLEPKTFFIIIMEYCPEGDLKEKIETEFMNFTEDWVRTVFAQLLQAVQYLHSKNVIHRDLKSQNVFLAQDGLVRLGDFGLCRRGGGTACRMSTLTHAGTDCYMAPEMLSSSRYGKPADMWSLGCVLYELCTGQFMWELDGMLGAMVMKDPHIVQKLVHDNVVAEVSSVLSSLIKRLLSTNPASRPTATACIRKRLFKRGFQLSRSPFGECLDKLEAEAEGDFSSRATSNIPLTITDYGLPDSDEKDGSGESSSSDEEPEPEANRSLVTPKQLRKRKARMHKGRTGGRR